MVSQVQQERVCGDLESGVSDGAQAIVGGERAGDGGFFVEPTVLVNTRPEMQVIQEEIFGPVVAAVPYDDPEELIAAANDSVYGLAAAVWTRDISKGHQLARQMRAGSVWVNCYNVFDASLPFGGYKQSGYSREKGQQALNAYLQIKNVGISLS